MNNTTAIARKHMLRGQVLILCNELKEVGAGVTLICMILNKQNTVCTEKEIADACYYLKGKKLIDFKLFRNEQADIQRDIAFITSDGIDVLEGTVAADGIALG